MGGSLAARLRPGDVVVLEGDLGAGKTEFVRGACEVLGVRASVVTSPTFTIVNEYQGDDATIYHIDLYRIEKESEFFDLGYEDYLTSGAISFIEWPERAAGILDKTGLIHVRFAHEGGNKRRIEINNR